MASVIHGFIYNKEAFAKAGVAAAPTTEEEFFAALDKIKAEGSYIPMAMGTNDQWEAATMGYQNIGPNYWGGEDGRLALIGGKQKLTDAALGRSLQDSGRWGRIISAMALRHRPIRTARHPLHTWPRGGLSGRILGDFRLPRQCEGSKWASFIPPVRKARRPMLHLGPCRHRTSA